MELHMRSHHFTHRRPDWRAAIMAGSNSHFKFLGAETDGVTIDFNNIADALVNFA